ncbi:hypothetical protein K458DRAFT_127725 [Lentithecium fluviatile CBS 122367]|uniref:Uncharacterized protein n=1 Tax=Lentithecium fluviatile CBS 122367 TaxID=1168545 RepID=A0A6G1JG73_9PLEO|nr:hypothetical protein K458DRAFT_127725 [Lentithecium fluviatile CBS 122367]
MEGMTPDSRMLETRGRPARTARTAPRKDRRAREIGWLYYGDLGNMRRGVWWHRTRILVERLWWLQMRPNFPGAKMRGMVNQGPGVVCWYTLYTNRQPWVHIWYRVYNNTSGCTEESGRSSFCQCVLN